MIRQPALIFAVTEATSGVPTATLYFGGGRAHRPRYDLGSMPVAAGQTLTGQRAQAAAYLREPSAAGRAWLGELQNNAAFDGSPALAFAMRPGATVDLRLYSHRRPLEITASHDGLSRVQLTPEELAVAREDLADVRIVDGQGQQWPYLMEPRAAKTDVLVSVKGPSGSNPSRYQLQFPVSPMAVDQLTLETEASFLDRPYRLNATIAADGEKKEAPVAAGRLVRRALDRGPLTIMVAASVRIQTAVPVRIALKLGSASHCTPISVLLFKVSSTRPLTSIRYRLRNCIRRARSLIGNPNDGPPRYELAQVREVVLALDGVPVQPAQLEKNPEYSVRARLQAGNAPQKIVLWIVLAAAVATLAFVTLRLARNESL